MKKKFLNYVLLVGMTACRTVQPYPEVLQSWIGKSEADLVATWGAPADMQTIAPNKQIFVYITEKQTFVPECLFLLYRCFSKKAILSV